MKIFVSGQINDLDNVRTVQKRLIESGHEIIHDWTVPETGENMLTGREAKLANIPEAQKRAGLDIQAVIDCDAFVMCTDNTELGKGMYAELGAALALNVTTGTPKVLILGSMIHMTVFQFHKSAIRLESVDEVIEELAQ